MFSKLKNNIDVCTFSVSSMTLTNCGSANLVTIPMACIQDGWLMHDMMSLRPALNLPSFGDAFLHSWPPIGRHTLLLCRGHTAEWVKTVITQVDFSKKQKCNTTVHALTCSENIRN